MPAKALGYAAVPPAMQQLLQWPALTKGEGDPTTHLLEQSPEPPREQHTRGGDA